MTIKITKQMVTEAICGHLCGIAEGATKSYELTDEFIIIRDWDNGKPLRATWEIILMGYHCYGTDRIPQFISRDWNKSVKIFKKLKSL